MAILVLGAMLLTYLGFLVYAIGFEPYDDLALPDIEIGTAKLVGEDAIRKLSVDWSEASLKRILDPRVHEQQWFQDLSARLPIFKEDLGALVTIASTVEAAKRDAGPKAKFLLFRLLRNTQRERPNQKFCCSGIPKSGAL